MDAALEQVRTDFDRIALASNDGWDHNTHRHAFLLSHLPERVGPALEVGCGTGAFSRLLARRSDHVLGIDLSPEMIRLARQRSGSHANATFEVGDMMTRPFAPDAFDVIATIATLHHLPLEPALLQLRDALRPGGTLLMLDLYTPRSASDHLSHALSWPWSALLRLRHRRPPPPAAVRRVWAEHGRRDRYPTLSEVRTLAATHLPGARVRRHLLWRYSLVWRKP